MTPAPLQEGYPVSRRYAWRAFAMTFALMLSDYMSRQMISAVFPFLKTEWSLSDGQLGWLVGIVALTVGVMTVPISLIADRVGRVRSAAAMALVWGLATVACGLAAGYPQLLAARALVGAGEAGYGSAGTAILTHAFPKRLHATVIGSLLAAGMFGSVLGVVAGGYLAQALGWKAGFILIGLIGVALAAVFPLLVREPAPVAFPDGARPSIGKVLAVLARTRTLWLISVAASCCMFVQSSFVAWMPSYLNRSYGLDPAKASLGTGVLIVCAAVGTVMGGRIVDRAAWADQTMRLKLAAVFSLVLGGALIAAFLMPPGLVQFALIALGLAASSSYLGPALAAATDVTPASSHATTYALVSLALMLLGAAPGPVLTGWIADASDLGVALGIVPVLALVSAGLFLAAARCYGGDRLDQSPG